jgi:hypothetical protein
MLHARNILYQNEASKGLMGDYCAWKCVEVHGTLMPHPSFFEQLPSDHPLKLVFSLQSAETVQEMLDCLLTGEVGHSFGRDVTRF